MKLDLNALKIGILKNLRNSQELIDEAEILFEKEKFARTYLLSHISIEESSKCAILLKVLAFNVWKEEINIQNVRKRYSNHKEKIKNFELMNTIIDKKKYNEFDFEKLIKDSNDSKNDSLYVSWSNENNFTLPSEIITKKKAEEKLQSALEYCKLFTLISIQIINDEKGLYEKLITSKADETIKEIIKTEKERKRK